ncbi:LOW QUALITY PROTEIN: hypothetical protein RJ641_036412 [Dillenia turbinata]|uniref:Uncharacterized protein n=1 Tax=Dillenia turbinata TaxID=194707 RepID=A0AAN8VED6_9MAGN
MQQPGEMPAFNLNAFCQERVLVPGSQSIPRTNSSVQIEQQNREQADIQQSEINLVLDHTMSQMLSGHMPLPKKNAPDAHSTTNKGQNMENSSASIQNTSTRNRNNSQDDRRNVYIMSDQQSLNEGIGQAVLQVINHQNLERAELEVWNNHQSFLKNLTNSYIATGIKRVSSHTTEQTHPQMVNLMEPLPFKAANNDDDSSHLRMALENQKRQKLQYGHGSALSTKPHSNPRLEDISRHVQTNCTTSAKASHLTSEKEHRNLISHFGENDILAKLASNTLVAGSYILSMDSGPDFTNKCTSTDPPQQAQRMTKKRSRKSTQVQDSASPTTNSKIRKQPSTKQNPPSTDEQIIEKSCVDLAASSQNVMPVAFDLAPPDANKGLAQQNGVNDHQEPHKRTQGFPKKRSYLDAVDKIMSRLNHLDLSKETNIAGQEQNALVLYKGDGALVPFDPIKKIKPPRPKVDLDPETNRVWNLLMGKEGSEGFEETDKEKEKWWEAERIVFQGRADSFIARMHLVQVASVWAAVSSLQWSDHTKLYVFITANAKPNDTTHRRPTLFKVERICCGFGVFLTQNVSDHLSSSAFMSLAARFPLQSNNKRSCCKDEVILVEESEIYIIDQDDAIKWHETVPREPIQKQSSATIYDPSGQIEATMMPNLGDIQSRRLEEEPNSSQDSP